MSNENPFDAKPDAELGAALRDALAMPFEAAFVNRVRARLNQRQAGWDEVLSRWFWQGLVAASLAALLAGWGIVQIAPSGTSSEDVASSTQTVASQLLDGSTPGAAVLLASWNAAETQ
jgi:hypothetical protein